MLHNLRASGVFYAAVLAAGAAPWRSLAGDQQGSMSDDERTPPMSKTERQRLIQTVVQQREVATQRELVSALERPWLRGHPGDGLARHPRARPAEGAHAPGPRQVRALVARAAQGPGAGRADT